MDEHMRFKRYLQRKKLTYWAAGALIQVTGTTIYRYVRAKNPFSPHPRTRRDMEILLGFKWRTK